MDLISLRFSGAEQEKVRRDGFALGRMGFRPFFLLAALFAVGAVPLWLLVLNGRVDVAVRGGALHWHAHEMVFGYTAAVIAGFLLTAVSRWTGRVTAVGAPLYGLAALWVAGRVALLVSDRVPALLVAGVDLAFLPAVAIFVGLPIVASKNRRNYVMLAVLGGLWVANLATHLEVLGLTQRSSAWGLRLALNLVTLMMLLIGARIIPMFTRNAVCDPRIRSHPRWDRATALFMGGLILADLVAAWPVLRAFLAGGTALSVLVAMRHWGTRQSLPSPLLWVLHLGYLWIPLSLLLQSLQLLGVPIAASSSIHALTAGAIGTLTLGMMSRVSLGHTGRPIVDHQLATISFALVTFAALVRVVAPELGLHLVREAWLLSGVAWALAFVAYLVRFSAMLWAPRVDGGAG